MIETERPCIWIVLATATFLHSPACEGPRPVPLGHWPILQVNLTVGKRKRSAAVGSPLRAE